jgi:UDP-N-acetylglucosamine--N-acetylmuramyl-(pentapeptide) pyrophosphoryl-undecaprenol N-acetylglucosamine transferase
MRTAGNHQQNNRVSTVFFTGGGTGGHVYPGIAVYESFLRLAFAQDLSIRGVWIGSKRGIEREIAESKGIRYIGIPSGKLRRYFSISNLIDIFKVFLGVVSAYLVIKRFRPVALFSKGGYVSVPPVIGAWLAKVPVITHESDLDPGLATRINARFACKVILSYDETRDFFAASLKPKLIAAGNPVRHEVLSGNPDRGKRMFSFTSDKPIVLVLGGSQGAREVNTLLWQALPLLQKKWNVVHQTGSDESGPPSGDGYRRYDYIHDGYADVITSASLVICRAGATTLWELAALRKPSILMPLGAEVSRGDQIRNAELFIRHGASYILKTGDPVTELVKYTDQFISEPNNLDRMGEAAASIYKPGAAEKIATILLKIVLGEVKTYED